MPVDASQRHRAEFLGLVGPIQLLVVYCKWLPLEALNNGGRGESGLGAGPQYRNKKHSLGSEGNGPTGQGHKSWLLAPLGRAVQGGSARPSCSAGQEPLSFAEASKQPCHSASVGLSVMLPLGLGKRVSQWGYALQMLMWLETHSCGLFHTAKAPIPRTEPFGLQTNPTEVNGKIPWDFSGSWFSRLPHPWWERLAGRTAGTDIHLPPAIQTVLGLVIHREGTWAQNTVRKPWIVGPAPRWQAGVTVCNQLTTNYNYYVNYLH